VRTILNNVGEDAPVIVGTLLAQYGAPDKSVWGYDAQKGAYMDMIKAGIVDRPKVVQTALDAAGAASLLTTSEACVVEAPEEDRPAGGAGWVVWADSNGF